MGVMCVHVQERHIQEVQKKKLTQTLSGDQDADTAQ
jgi:hypothetical protein